MAFWCVAVALAAGGLLRGAQPGCEEAEANARNMLQQCESETAQFEQERDEYVKLLNSTMAELDKSLEYWQQLAGEVSDDFRSSPLLDPSTVLVSQQSPAGCDEVTRLHLRVQQCRSLLSNVQVYAKKSILGMEGMIKDKRARLEGYKQRVARVRAEEAGGWDR